MYAPSTQPNCQSPSAEARGVMVEVVPVSAVELYVYCRGLESCLALQPARHRVRLVERGCIQQLFSTVLHTAKAHALQRARDFVLEHVRHIASNIACEAHTSED
eukprot:1470734-Prymnesium_polylepis.1